MSACEGKASIMWKEGELACGGEGDGCAKGSIYSVPKEGVLLFFWHGNIPGGWMPSTLDWEGEIWWVDIRI